LKNKSTLSKEFGYCLMNKVLFLLLLTTSALVTSCTLFDRYMSEKQLHKIRYERRLDLPTLAHWSQHPNPNIRLKTVKTLGILQDTLLVDLLADRLHDADPQIRSAAIFGLGQLFHPAAEAPLLAALQDSTLTPHHTEILTALGKSGSAKASTVITNMIPEADTTFQKSASMALAIMGYRGVFFETFPSHLSVLLHGNSAEIRWRSAYALYRIGALRSFGDLEWAATQAPDSLTRFYGLKGLHRLVTLTTTASYREKADGLAYRSLEQHMQSRLFKNRIAALLSDPHFFNVVVALQILGDLQDTNYLSNILALTEHPHPQIRYTALQAARRFKNRTTERFFEKLVQSDSDWRLRGEALIGLAVIAPRKAFQLISHQAQTAIWPQTYYLIVALDSIKTANPTKPLSIELEATKLLEELSNSDQPAQSTLAVEALIGRNIPPSIDFFIAKLREGDIAQTTIIANYIALMEPPRPVQFIKPLIDVAQKFKAPKDLEAIQAVIVALDSLKSEEALPLFERYIDSPFTPLRRSAQNALSRIAGKPIEIDFSGGSQGMRTDFPPLSPDSVYFATVQTEAGTFRIHLLTEAAPVTCANFRYLALSGYFNGILVHRVVPAFVMQTGDPRGDGWGGPGYAIPCEYNPHSYFRGTVGMALAGKDTGGSQWFITHLPQPHLDGRYTVFGTVTNGMDIVDKVQKFDPIINIKIHTEPKKER
jgi:cyclophilin family peptidyl-prolyl cis-trans isomerase/HEAT repeat protein